MSIRQLIKPSGSLSVFLLVLTLFITFNTILFSGTPLFAKTWYVKPSSEVVIRKGQSNGYKIIAIVKNGVSVELLEEDKSYAKVRLANGKEGWMLKRFLSTAPPLEEVVISLRTEKEKIEQNSNDLAQKLKEVSSALAQTEIELNSTLAEKEQITTNYQALQRDTADVVQTKTDLLQATKENESLIKELASIKAENNNLKKNNTFKWFLAGGGVLLVGILLGKISGQSRRKKSLL
jgi:SH3 domain protein